MSVLDDFKDIENQQHVDIKQEIKQEIISEIYNMYIPLIDQLNHSIVNLQGRIDDLDRMVSNNLNDIATIKSILKDINERETRKWDIPKINIL